MREGARIGRQVRRSVLPVVTPEREVWIEILYRARLDLLGEHLYLDEGDDPDQVRQDVVEWLNSEHFGTVCQLAGVPEEVARGLFIQEAVGRG